MKIYTEVSIDMNPESSSYGEHLHEESFDYNGPMALLQGAEGGAEDDTLFKFPEGGYNPEMHWGHPWYSTGYNTGRGENLGPIKNSEKRGEGWLIRTEDDWWVVTDADGNILSHRSSEDTGTTTARNWADEFVFKATEDITGVKEVAPDIKYEDFIGFFNEEGDVKDQPGLIKYLQQFPGVSQNEHEVWAQFEDLPKLGAELSIDPDELAEKERVAGEELKEDIYGFHTELGKKREETASAMGKSGVLHPTATGFGTGDKSISEGLYSDISGAKQADITAAKGYYGLYDEAPEEQAMADFISTHLT